MVGHYWLRAPELAPSPAITDAIRAGVKQVKDFAARMDGRFSDVLLIGIGGSALGPMFVADALGGPGDRMRMHFLDNTDPDGIARTLAGWRAGWTQTLAIVTSKSGGTPETRNGMVLAAAAWQKCRARVCEARRRGHDGWIAAGQAGGLGKLAGALPDVRLGGGRTSELSAVGLLPAALQGIDIDALLDGAAACDRATRAARHAAEPGGADGPDVASRRPAERERKTWWCCRTRTGCCCSAGTCSNW